MKTIVASLIVMMTSLPAMAQFTPEVIYGNDDRKDIFDPGNSELELRLATSTAALTYTANLTDDGDFFKLPEDTFGDRYNLCEDEPFRNQPNPAHCSGFLVAPNVLVTAGHCIENDDDCANTSFVFGFGYDTADKDVTRVAKRDVFKCNRIIAQELTGGRGTDYAVIELDRNVEDREPLEFRRTGTIENGTPLVVIGHPAGLPTKIAGGAAVRDNLPAAYFVANLDTYGGNSGSAVFNADTGVVEGILVRGETDFETQDGCRVSYRCTDLGCRGEDVTKATVFAAFVPGGDDPDPRPTRTFEFEESNIDADIPDDNRDGVTHVIDVHVGDDTEIADIGVHVKLTHSYVGDLTLILIHPDGTEALLQSRQGGAGDHLDRVYGMGGQQVASLFRLRGKDVEGAWQLKIVDDASSDTGTLQYVKLSAKVYVGE